jgi:pimeloyl-ACP methyl ester carboxylesterase
MVALMINLQKEDEMKRYFHHKGKKIYYSDHGTGEPLVLIHGYLETSDVWSQFISRMEGEFRILAIDLPGHGSSDNFSTIHTMEFMAETVESLLNAAGVEKGFIIGHSMGGYVTLALLDRVPQRFSGYCLFHSHPFADSRHTIEKRISEINLTRSGKKFVFYPGNIRNLYAEKNREIMASEIARSQKIASSVSSEGITAVLYGMMERPERVSLIEKGTVPFLWILGTHDSHISCDSMKQKVKMPANSELVILENSGHMGFIEEEDLSVRIVSDFVKKMVRKGS